MQKECKKVSTTTTTTGRGTFSEITLLNRVHYMWTCLFQHLNFNQLVSHMINLYEKHVDTLFTVAASLQLLLYTINLECIIGGDSRNLTFHNLTFHNLYNYQANGCPLY